MNIELRSTATRPVPAYASATDPHVRRICTVLRKFESSQWGGAETHVIELTRHLRHHGFESELWAPSAREPADPERGDLPEVRRFRAYAPYVGSRASRASLIANGGNLVAPWLLAQLLLAPRPSAFHVHTGGRVAGVVRTCARLMQIPYVVTMHGPVLASQGITQGTGGTRSVWDLGMPFGALVGSRRALLDANRVIVFSREELRACQKVYGDRVVRLDQGVMASRFRNGSPHRVRALYPCIGPRPYVLVLGRLCTQKNQLGAVEAFARASDGSHSLVLAGAETEAGYQQRVVTRARELGISDRVHCVGNVTGDVVPDLLAGATVLFTPSVHEAFGLVVLEAWAAGCPTFFARRHGLADIAEALGIEDSSESDLGTPALARGLARMLHSADLRAAIRSRGQQLIAERYTWERTASAQARLYDEVLAESEQQRSDLRAQSRMSS